MTETEFRFKLDKQSRSKKFILEHPYATIKITRISLTNSSDDPILWQNRADDLCIEITSCDSRTSMKEVKSLLLSSIIKESYSTGDDFDLEVPRKNILAFDNKSMAYDSVEISIPEEYKIDNDMQLSFNYTLYHSSTDNEQSFLSKQNLA